MFDVSLPWANFWYDAFNAMLFLGAFAVAVGTYGSIKMGAVKERFSDERTTSLETQTSQAKAELGKALADIAKANVQITEATARTKEAELKMEQLRERMRPRNIKGEQFLKILEGKPKAPVEILFVRDDGEAFQLAMQVRDWLKLASWAVEEPRSITAGDMAPRMAQYPSQYAAGGQPEGVSVFLRAETQADFEREKDPWPIDPNNDLNTPRKALAYALLDSLGALAGGMSGENGRPGVLRIIVGPKPHLN